MSEGLTNKWKETCLQALWEWAPDRRMAVLEKLRNIVHAEQHKSGSVWIDLERAEVKRSVRDAPRLVRMRPQRFLFH